ncbi:transposase [Neisseria sp. 74A18]|uniref:transposase n=1 Tax=Neisseria sp. 74A18 TaxID=1696094 RepID=UPI0012E14C10
MFRLFVGVGFCKGLCLFRQQQAHLSCWPPSTGSHTSPSGGLPPYSPDLNPIEKKWAWIKKKWAWIKRYRRKHVINNVRR